MDNSPTTLFDSYEQDFQQIIDSIKEKLDRDVKDAGAGKLVTGPDVLWILKYYMIPLQNRERQTCDESRWNWRKLTRWYACNQPSTPSCKC